MSRLGLVALGGLVGSLLRHLVAGSPGEIPWAVLWVNLAGALMAGFLVARVRRHASGSRLLLPLAVVGVAGSLTTFGGLVVDGVMLMEADQVADAVRYVGASFLLGPVAAVAGIAVGGRT